MLLRALEFAQCLRTIKQMSQTDSIQVVVTEYVATGIIYDLRRALHDSHEAL